MSLYSGSDGVIDWGYFLHVYMTDLCGAAAPRPFACDTRRLLEGFVSVLGYTTMDHATIRKDATHFADPVVWSGVDWEQSASRPMPTEFRIGTQLGFGIQVCPVNRTKDAITHRRVERDAVFYQKNEVHIPSFGHGRSQAYGHWLRKQMNLLGGCAILQTRMVHFDMEPMIRRDHKDEREKVSLTRPVAKLEGRLAVIDSGAFLKTIRMGVGRHKGFGFGLLLLKRG